jgi:L-lactate dehydrogenase complex protein LldG
VAKAESGEVSAREEILDRIRAATADVPDTEAPAWDRDREVDPAAVYVRERPEPAAERIARFRERMRGHGAGVAEVAEDPAAIAAAIAAACERLDVSSVVVPPDLPAEWAPTNVEVARDEPPLELGALAEVDCLLSGAALAIADTGTIALDGGPAQGRRALSLLPDVHVCVVRSSQVFGTVPEAVARLLAGPRAGRQLTLISGPSATSDIAFQRVVGVHGPRRFEVVLVGEGGA